jgi:hypothetical protein
MKKQLFSVLSFLMLCIGMTAQTNIANYTFASSMGTYVPITGASTFVTTWDNNISAAIPLGGTFTFGTATYTTCYISSNGFITFGGAPTGTNYTPMSTLGSATGAISAYGQDANSSEVAGATPAITYTNIGGATGEFVVQYADHANYFGRSTERLNFQIRLNLATGAINIVYGSWTAPSPAAGTSGITAHVGIRGNSTTWTSNVNSLNTLDVPAGTTCSWANAVTSNANNSSMLFSSSNPNIAPANGLTFTWAPPAVALAPVRTFSATTGITGTSANLAWTAPTGATQYDVQYRVPGTCAWTNFSGNPVLTNSVTLTGLTPSTVYQIRVKSSDGTNNAIWSHIPNTAGTGSGYSATGTFSTTSPACSGAPTAGTAVATSTSICSATNFTVNLTGSQTGVTGLTYQWYSSPDGVTYTAIPSATLISAVLTQTAATYYQNVVSCGASSSTSTPVQVMQNSFLGCYCTTTPGTVNGVDIITGVKLSNSLGTVFTNTSSSNGTTNFDTYNNTPVDLVRGTTNNTVSITYGTDGTQYGAAWIDFNRNGIYEASENIGLAASSAAGGATVNYTFTVPAGASLGNTRMRVRGGSDGAYTAGGACTSSSYGETEDYLVNIIIPPTCYVPTGLTTTNATTSSIDLSWTAPAMGTPVNYIFEIRTSGAAGSGTLGVVSTGTVVAPITSVTASGLSALTAYTVYIVSDCGAGDMSLWSAGKTFTTLANCPVPTAFNTSTVMATSATFTWVAGGSETAWDVYYGTQPLTAPTASTPATATTSVASYTASVLTQTTAYSAYVRANCGAGNTSVWTAVTNFTTPASCPATSSVAISAVTPTSAVATWTAGGAETSWYVKYSAPTMTAIAGPTPSYTMSGLTPSTNYSVQVKGICGAADSSLWTVVSTFMTPCLPPNVINPMGSTRCGTGTTTLSATADMGGSINWYTGPTGGTAVATGTLFTTPSISVTTNYYASAVGGLLTENVGKPAATNATGFLTTPDWGIQFSTTKQVLINSVTIYPVGTGSVTIAVVNASGTELMASPSMAVTGTGTNTPVVLNLGFNVPQGTGYRMVLKAYSGITDLIRESSGNTFPYTAASGALSVTAGWNGSASTSYYWFYNLNISTGCESARTMITASVTTAPALTFNAPAPVCGGSGIATLSVTSNMSDYDSYMWSPATGLYTDAAATMSYTPGTSASVVYVNSMNSGIMNYNVSANNTVSGCATSGSASVTILDAPTSITVAATPSTICAGSTVSLSATANAVGTTLLDEGFNGATNSWTTINNSTGGTPAAAAWTLRPSNYVLPGTTFTGTLVSNDNTQLYLTNSDQQGSGSKTRSILQSPAFSTMNMTTLTLNFYHFYKYWATGDSAVMVQVSTNGTSWTTIKDYKTAAVDAGSPNALASASLSLNSYTNNPTVYVRFNYNSTWGYGWAIDNVKVTGTSTNAYSYGWTSNPAGFTAATATATDMPMASTVYSVVITNTNTSCSNSGSVSVTVNAVPTVTASASSTSVCAGTSATLTAGGATNYTWTAGGNASTEVVTPGASSVYTVTGETSGCSNTATVSVDVTPIPTVMATASSTLVCSNFGESSVLTASTTATTYSWSNGDATMSTTVTPTSGTTYTLTVTEAGCSASTTIFIDAQICMAVNNLSALDNSISIYPNPTNGIVNIAISTELSGTTSVEIYDAIGKLVISEKLSKDVTTVNTSKLEDGMYMYKIINNNKAIKVGRMIKQ